MVTLLQWQKAGSPEGLDGGAELAQTSASGQGGRAATQEATKAQPDL